MKHKALVITVSVFALLVLGSFLLGVVSYLFVSSDEDGLKSVFSSGEVGLVNIEGGIYFSHDIVERLDKYRNDKSIKAVVVRIESPGGSLAASQEIYEAIKRVAKEKPVIASMGDVAASGGYYVACGANKIVANPGTITGSIGVRMELVQIGELLTWAKIQHETLKSGKFKDIGSPDRPLTLEERELLEKLLVEMHGQFKKTVSESRDIKLDKLNEIADGRVFTGEQAKELGLVDELGGLFDAVQIAGKLAGIKGEPNVVEKYKDEEDWWVKYFFESAMTRLDKIISESLIKKINSNYSIR
ncbi:MAG: signal peptide peptidase SppA [Deltaproteobacteria bacterium CG07_land_8_20_14_0_80_38_7]|nr:MAG: signal peptide peptidase SppA [Deltaproteobacteria bacterium CG07_land_8_20_14_0_80_38_7]